LPFPAAQIPFVISGHMLLKQQYVLKAAYCQGHVGRNPEVCSLAVEIEAGTPSAQLGRSGPYVRLRAPDNGTGMDRATLERIFEPFYTPEPR
jgi:signal transduction histidine kinase